MSFLSRCLLGMLAASSVIAGTPVSLSPEYGAGQPFMGIRIMGAVQLARQQVDGFLLSELSALAWDEDEGLLYAISDNGYLFHLRPTIEQGELRDVEALAGYPLRDGKGQWLTGSETDSEGMVLRGGGNGQSHDAQLLISFEREPRLRLYTPQGEALGKVTLAKTLRDIRRYASANKALEAVAEHPKYGVITAPEWPLKAADARHHTLYSGDGRQWRIERYPSAYSAVVALETLPDGGLLVQERVYESLFAPFIIRLVRAWPTPGCEGPAGPACKSEVLAEFDSTKGWNIDNFEGLTHFRGRQYFLVSDDNDKPYQRTLVLLIELMDARLVER